MVRRGAGARQGQPLDAVLGIYRYHTGMDCFFDYKSLVLVCGLAKWSGTILIKIPRLHAIHTKNLIPILAELSILGSKASLFITRPLPHNPKYNRRRVFLLITHIPTQFVNFAFLHAHFAVGTAVSGCVPRAPQKWSRPERWSIDHF